MRVGGASALLISGGFLSFAEPIARLIGFDRVKANKLLFDGGHLSGRVADPIIDGAAKRSALLATREELGLSSEDVLAIGDGANDSVDHRLCHEQHRHVRDQAPARIDGGGQRDRTGGGDERADIGQETQQPGENAP